VYPALIAQRLSVVLGRGDEGDPALPKSIVNFERLMLASIVLGIVHVAILWSETPFAVNLIALAVAAAVIGIIVGLTLLISRRRSKIALWVFVGLFVLGVPSTVKTVIATVTQPPGFVMALQAICQTIALVLLFTPSARNWMKRKPDPVAEAEIFS
jgi:hypothetical protein